MTSLPGVPFNTNSCLEEVIFMVPAICPSGDSNVGVIILVVNTHAHTYTHKPVRLKFIHGKTNKITYRKSRIMLAREQVDTDAKEAEVETVYLFWVQLSGHHLSSSSSSPSSPWPSKTASCTPPSLTRTCGKTETENPDRPLMQQESGHYISIFCKTFVYPCNETSKRSGGFTVLGYSLKVNLS